VEVRARFYEWSFWRRLAVRRDFEKIRKIYSFAESGKLFCVRTQYLVETNPGHSLGSRVREWRVRFHANDGFPVLKCNSGHQIANETYHYASLSAIDLYGILDPSSKAA
jgi:hypothetical protein